jgi:hypothetical protein
VLFTECLSLHSFRSEAYPPASRGPPASRTRKPDRHDRICPQRVVNERMKCDQVTTSKLATDRADRLATIPKLLMGYGLWLFKGSTFVPLQSLVKVMMIPGQVAWA